MTDGGPDVLNPHDLIETVPLLDIYADGIAMVEPLVGDNWRITYFAYKRMPGSSQVTRDVVAKVVRHRSSLVEGQITAMMEKWLLARAGAEAVEAREMGG